MSSFAPNPISVGCVICRAAGTPDKGYVVRARQLVMIVVSDGDDPVTTVIDDEWAYVCQVCYARVFGASRKDIVTVSLAKGTAKRRAP